MTPYTGPDFKIRYLLTALFFLVSLVTLVQAINYLGVLLYGLEFLTWWPLGEAVLFGLGGKPESSLIAHVSGLAIEIAVPELAHDFTNYWLARARLSLITTGLFLLVLITIRRMLVTIDIKKPFDAANIRRVQFIILLLVTDIFVLDYFRTESMKPLKSLLSDMPAPILDADSSYQNADVHAYILILLLFTLVAIFRRGMALYQEQRELEQRLYQKQKLEALGTMASGIGHDFNNILTSIVGYAEMAKQEANNQGAEFALTRVLESCQRAKQLTQQIRAIGQQPATHEQDETLDLKQEVDELLLSIAPSIPSAIEIIKDYHPDVKYEIQTDSTKLYQVLLNLATNALQAMGPDQGKLTLTLSQQAQKGRSGVHLSVSDTGTGIEAEHLPHIFEPYYSTKKHDGGTGLGLALCQSIVQGMGGEISVDSEVGKGTRFHIWLPAADVEPKRDAAINKRHQGKRIILVDDDREILELVTRRLTALGYCIAAFRDAEAALKAVSNSTYEYALVLTDLNMPTLSGLDFAKKLKRLDRNTPVILLSATPEQVDLQTEQNLFHCSVTKPINFSELHTRISQALALADQTERIAS